MSGIESAFIIWTNSPSITLIRIYVDEKDQDITFSVEQFCDSMDEYRPFFSRALDILDTDINLFRKAFDEVRAKRNETAQRFLA